MSDDVFSTAWGEAGGYSSFCSLIRFDSDLSVAKEDAASERQEKEKLARGKDTLRTDFESLENQLKEAKEELEKANLEKEDLQAELLAQTSASTESELTSLKRMKRELESKLEAMEDDLDEANLKSVVIHRPPSFNQYSEQFESI